MSQDKKVRFGIVGVGGMGSAHARCLLDGQVRDAVLTAVCDIEPEALARFPEVSRFGDSGALIRSGEVDAVLVATPHYGHTPISIDALDQGLHVLTEKPMGVHKADCEKMIAAYERNKARGVVFAEMFNQRTDPHYKKLRELLQSGELGAIQRITWIITDWFRSEAYYRSGGWRATWAGEGGGVLLNQCPHNIDLWQWLFGMPRKVRAFCGFGRYHDIEVEDQVTAYLEYENGAQGVFIASTGEAPGSNRLEVAGNRGKIVVEWDHLDFVRTEMPVSEFSLTTSERFAAPPVWKVRIPIQGSGPQHQGILQNFTDSILGKAELLAPAVEGIHSVELANAMLFSTFRNETVELPLDAQAYETMLKKLIAESRYEKPAVVAAQGGDLGGSFSGVKA
jgi:predicted dehydrogenase